MQHVTENVTKNIRNIFYILCNVHDNITFKYIILCAAIIYGRTITNI